MSEPQLPHVSLCLAASMDGKISAGSGPPDFTSRYDRDKLFSLRAKADALLVGANTVRHEKLAPLIRNQDGAQWRKKAGKTPHPAVVLVSNSLRLPWESGYFTKAQQDILLITSRLEQNRPPARLGLKVIETGTPLNLRNGLQQLHALGYEHVLAEGGGTLVHGLLEQRLVRRFYLTIAPVMLGEMGTAPLCNGGLQTRAEFALTACDRHQNELHLEYELKGASRPEGKTS